MLEFLIMLWLIIALVIEIPKLIKELKNLIKGIPEDIDKFILK